MNTRKFSGTQEKNIAKSIGAKKQCNSGATAFKKGDVVSKKFLIEAKTATTEKASFSIKSEWIKKNKEEAFAMGKEHSVIAFNFGGLNNKENFYIISEDLFKELVQYIEGEI